MQALVLPSSSDTKEVDDALSISEQVETLRATGGAAVNCNGRVAQHRRNPLSMVGVRTYPLVAIRQEIAALSSQL
ncbi:MAG: hypothetical protein FD148_85 [Methylocystaceae bacterium]|nr:MAG: hypothetical protein FD148_85 [Methylocystaceae bacterium]